MFFVQSSIIIDELVSTKEEFDKLRKDLSEYLVIGSSSTMSLTKSDTPRETEEQQSVLQKTSLESEVRETKTTLERNINHKVSS